MGLEKAGLRIMIKTETIRRIPYYGSTIIGKIYALQPSSGPVGRPNAIL